ncbi:hypothetical protein GWI33_020757 [Rhynchophorus ferrugineus]|uniref:Uncharacterized protein n=1 Tax=Rhynchophorus ferrugineus TaxID=354439 RepID=A0A834HPY2_RHYFE|nr:hypothetical protein GWI33_020757 [Rhynchophorus ferrugineus]
MSHPKYYHKEPYRDSTLTCSVRIVNCPNLPTKYCPDIKTPISQGERTFFPICQELVESLRNLGKRQCVWFAPVGIRGEAIAPSFDKMKEIIVRLYHC